MRTLVCTTASDEHLIFSGLFSPKRTQHGVTSKRMAPRVTALVVAALVVFSPGLSQAAQAALPTPPAQVSPSSVGPTDANAVPMTALPTGADQNPCDNVTAAGESPAGTAVSPAVVTPVEETTATPNGIPASVPGVVAVAPTQPSDAQLLREESIRPLALGGTTFVASSIVGFAASVTMFAIAAERQRRASYPSVEAGGTEQNDMLARAQGTKNIGTGLGITSAVLMIGGVWMVTAGKRRDGERKERLDASRSEGVTSIVAPVFTTKGGGLTWRLSF